MDRLEMESMHQAQQNIEKIAALFPGVITEIKDKNGKIKRGIDFERLKQELSDTILPGEEGYAFSWVGKKAAIAESNMPVRKTLRPCIAESRNWERTKNLYIEGDNLDVLKLLQKGYANSIKMIYIDPPYNNGIDFVYRDNYALDRGIYKGSGNRWDKNNLDFRCEEEAKIRLHSGWCSMMYPRLRLAFHLLSEDGVVFISIDDTEIDNLKKMCNEIFGESNFITIIALEITKTQGMKVKSAKEGSIVKNSEYILCYTKKASGKKIVKNILYDKNEGYDTHFSFYIEKTEGQYQIKKLVDVLKENKAIYDEFARCGLVGKRGEIQLRSLASAIAVSKKIREYIYSEIAQNIYQEMACSITLHAEAEDLVKSKEIFEYRGYLLTRSAGGKLRQYGNLSDTLRKNDEYKSEYGRVTIRGNLWKGFYSDMMNVAKEGGVEYKNGKKPVRLIGQLANWVGVKERDTVLDFFSGSATTAHAVMKMNAADLQCRRYIMIQINEDLDQALKQSAGAAKREIRKTIRFLDSVQRPHILSELGKERILRVAQRLEQETETTRTASAIDTGFRVFKLDSSNMKEAFFEAKRPLQGSNSFWACSIKKDRTQMDLLFGILLNLGLELTANYRREVIAGFHIYIVEEKSLFACFSPKATASFFSEIAKKQPENVVFVRNGSCSEQEILQIFKNQSPYTKVYWI